jgi:hypothetical protein
MAGRGLIAVVSRMPLIGSSIFRRRALAAALALCIGPKAAVLGTPPVPVLPSPTAVSSRLGDESQPEPHVCRVCLASACFFRAFLTANASPEAPAAWHSAAFPLLASP